MLDVAVDPNVSVHVVRVPLREEAQGLPLCELRPGGDHPLEGMQPNCGQFADYLVSHHGEVPGVESWAACCSCLETAVSFELPEKLEGTG